MNEFDRAAWAHPENPSHQEAWIKAIIWLRSRPRGWILEANSKPIYEPPKAELPPRYASKVVPIQRKGNK